FSSRRRHTRAKRDWSSDVCSSDLIGAGTLMGGHRIIRTLGRRLTDLTVAQGLAAEVSAATTMSLSLFGLSSPISTSHALASSVVGAGAAKGLRNVRWRVA